MRAAVLTVIASLILALAAVPTPAQVPNPNPDLLKASWVNLNRVVRALENYFVDFGRYPQSIVELTGIGGRQYLAELPVDPCTGARFGALTGYGYIPLGPSAGYVLRTNWSWIGYGADCYSANNNANMQYSPRMGLQLTP